MFYTCYIIIIRAVTRNVFSVDRKTFPFFRLIKKIKLPPLNAPVCYWGIKRGEEERKGERKEERGFKRIPTTPHTNFQASMLH